ncbi:MAG: OmpA family protein [Desulfamplus sp.]|nr:OmpA family protein [Desulfamplus sp.]
MKKNIYRQPDSLNGPSSENRDSLAQNKTSEDSDSVSSGPTSDGSKSSGATSSISASTNSNLKGSHSDHSSFSSDPLDPFSDDLLTYAAQENTFRWSVSWSDLMMTMFIFFAVLYIYKSGNRELEFGQGAGQKNISDSGSGLIIKTNAATKPSEIYDEAKKALKDTWVNGSTSVELVKDKAIRITLSGDLFFDTGRADLKTEAIWELRQVAQVLRENSFIVNVVGHTDSVPNHSDLFPTNWELSTARACRVARFLIEDEGIEEERFFVSGHSWHQPIVPNNSVQNRSLNRRVEILLMKEMPYLVSELPLSTTGQAPYDR